MAKKDANPLTELLRPHVAVVKAAASKGDATAQRIINLYRLHLDCPNDPGAPTLCEAVAREWLKEKGLD